MLSEPDHKMSNDHPSPCRCRIPINQPPLTLLYQITKIAREDFRASNTCCCPSHCQVSTAVCAWDTKYDCTVPTRRCNEYLEKDSHHSQPRCCYLSVERTRVGVAQYP